MIIFAVTRQNYERTTFNATREQWEETYRNARILNGYGREPKLRTCASDTMLWHAFTIITDTREYGDPLVNSTARSRLNARRFFGDDFPF